MWTYYYVCLDYYNLCRRYRPDHLLPHSTSINARMHRDPWLFIQIHEQGSGLGTYLCILKAFLCPHTRLEVSTRDPNKRRQQGTTECVNNSRTARYYKDLHDTPLHWSGGWLRLENRFILAQATLPCHPSVSRLLLVNILCHNNNNCWIRWRTEYELFLGHFILLQCSSVTCSQGSVFGYNSRGRSMRIIIIIIVIDVGEG